MSTEVLDVEITEISKNYQVRRLGRDDVDAIYELCRENRIFYRYHEPFVTKESILDDMEALPPGKSREDKSYLRIRTTFQITVQVALKKPLTLNYSGSVAFR